MKILLKTVKWSFIVFCFYLISLFFREERLPGAWVERAVSRWLPEGTAVSVGSFSVGLASGMHMRDVQLSAAAQGGSGPILSARAVDVFFFSRQIRVEGLRYSRLPEDYYRPENLDRNEPLEARFPQLGRFTLLLENADVLGIRPATLECDIDVMPRRIDVGRIRLVWPDRGSRMAIHGSCAFDLDRQEVVGEIEGLARQDHIRPLIVALDVPVALPYMDAFTEVPEPCPSKCAWRIDLVRKDFDLWLDLHPVLGKYNGVPMRRADGRIHLHNCTRDNCLNYVTTVGPILGVDRLGRELEGTVTVTGTNGFNTVDVKATSALPLADVLKVGGFTGEYVSPEAIGRSACDLQFRFPRAMSNNYEVLNGRGRVTVESGHLMRLGGFRGLIEAMPSIAPAVTWFSDTTQASGDYVIENGVVKSDNICIEGTCFSIRMSGQFDAVGEKLDFKVLVQFAKKDSLVGKVLHPLTWPFSKLLLEFRLTGSPDRAEWKYVSIIDRVVEAVR